MNNRYDYQPSPLKFFGQDDPEFQEDDYFNSKPKQNDSFKRDGFSNDRFAQQNDSYQRVKYGNSQQTQQSTNNTTYSEYNYQQNKKVIDEKVDDGVIRIGPQKGPAAVIISILVLIYFFGSMIGIILTAKINPAITLILFGQLFFVFGSIAFIASKNKMKDIFLLLFPLIGGGVMLAGGVMLSDDKELIDKLTEFAPLLLLILFLFIGVGITISTITKEIKAKNRCTAEVEAVVVDVKSRLSSGKNRHRVYCPIFEYQYYGQTFQKSPDVYTNVGVPKIGDTKTVYINPNDPTDLYIKNYSATILSLILGLLFTGFSLLALFSVIPTYF